MFCTCLSVYLIIENVIRITFPDVSMFTVHLLKFKDVIKCDGSRPEVVGENKTKIIRRFSIFLVENRCRMTSYIWKYFTNYVYNAC